MKISEMIISIENHSRVSFLNKGISIHPEAQRVEISLIRFPLALHGLVSRGL